MKLSVLHVVCVAVIAGCYALAFTVLKDNEEAATVLCGAATFLWGKLAFKPANALIEKIVQSMEPEEVVALKSRTPPPAVGAPMLSIVPAPPPPAGEQS